MFLLVSGFIQQFLTILCTPFVPWRLDKSFKVYKKPIKLFLFKIFVFHIYFCSTISRVGNCCMSGWRGGGETDVSNTNEPSEARPRWSTSPNRSAMLGAPSDISSRRITLFCPRAAATPSQHCRRGNRCLLLTISWCHIKWTRALVEVRFFIVTVSHSRRCWNKKKEKKWGKLPGNNDSSPFFFFHPPPEDLWIFPLFWLSQEND